MSSTSPSKEYFFRLDALRFVAFSLVFLNHIPSFLHFPQSVGTPDTPAFVYLQMGDLGVGFFFVLSGFLITYLLEKERAKTGTISFKNFYIRRILRIWPLYFLALGIIIAISLAFSGFTLYKTHIDWHEITWYLFLVGNIFRAFQHTSNEMIAILWSVAVEEQFYLIWPIIFFTFRKYIGWVLALGAAVSMAFRYHYANQFEVREFYTFTVMIYLFVGAAIGVYAQKLRGWFEDGQKRGRALCVAIAGAAGVVGLLSVRGFVFPYGYPQWFIALDGLLFALFFAGIILAAAFGTSARNEIVTVRGVFEKTLEYLGGISYGLYVYHLIALTTVVYVVQKIGFNPAQMYFAKFALLALCTFGLTVALAAASHAFWEKPFLSLKEKFVKVS